MLQCAYRAPIGLQIGPFLIMFGQRNNCFLMFNFDRGTCQSCLQKNNFTIKPFDCIIRVVFFFAISCILTCSSIGIGWAICCAEIDDIVFCYVMCTSFTVAWSVQHLFFVNKIVALLIFCVYHESVFSKFIWGRKHAHCKLTLDVQFPALLSDAISWIQK